MVTTWRCTGPHAGFGDSERLHQRIKAGAQRRRKLQCVDDAAALRARGF
jgi:hypothetical protein